MQCCEILALLKLDISTNDPEKCTKSNNSLMMCFYTDSQQGAVLIFLTMLPANFLTMLPANKALCWKEIAFYHSQSVRTHRKVLELLTIPATFVNNSWLLHNLLTCQKMLLVLLGPYWTAKCIVRYVLGENISVFMKYRGEKWTWWASDPEKESSVPVVAGVSGEVRRHRWHYSI